ncbi:sucrose phosphorylase [Lacticaseibacillus mingshuiensis]|uniref:sucrose phosphorylase n=1 Tax=Lacticaseibacillus mingshuiensis TaxID=2799574 RepID=UPI0019518BEA|nr:sucrose phosphorylase [Lacticaseibacillus mingshuiensis]
MGLSNQVMLITYADSLGSNLQALNRVLVSDLTDAIGGLHILPFFPSSGDRGFSPERYDVIDSRFGDWTDIAALASQYFLMTDLMINHLSRKSPEFKDFIAKGDASPSSTLFLDWDKFWPAGHPTQEEVDQIYKRKDKAPVQEVQMADGSVRHVWNTFSDEQIDLDVTTPETWQYLTKAMKRFAANGVALIRLDAFAYAVKKRGTNDFFVEPEIWDLLDRISEAAGEDGVEVLPEIHEHYTLVDKVNQRGYWTYDFALPMLVLYTLFAQDARPLLKWLRRSPMHQFTTLDTHDGIGVVDVKDILSDDQIDFTTQQLYQRGSNVKKVYSSAAYHNLDVYQINSTYFSALGENEAAYLIARAIQMFAPGIPQVYYVGLLAGANDLDLLEKTKEGRNINRHYYTEDEVAEEVQRPVVSTLLNLMRFRNRSRAFDLDGQFEAKAVDPAHFVLTRTSQDGQTNATLCVDLVNDQMAVSENGVVIDLTKR